MVGKPGNNSVQFFCEDWGIEERGIAVLFSDCHCAVSVTLPIVTPMTFPRRFGHTVYMIRGIDGGVDQIVTRMTLAAVIDIESISQSLYMPVVAGIHKVDIVTVSAPAVNGVGAGKMKRVPGTLVERPVAVDIAALLQRRIIPTLPVTVEGSPENDIDRTVMMIFGIREEW